MSYVSLKPQPGEREEWAKRMTEAKPWWIDFDEPVSVVFCDKQHVASVFNADYGLAWAGVGCSHRPRRMPTNDQEVMCYEFQIPIDRMVVEEQFMKGWMEVVRANSFHGHYRKAGTEKEYRF